MLWQPGSSTTLARPLLPLQINNRPIRVSLATAKKNPLSTTVQVLQQPPHPSDFDPSNTTLFIGETPCTRSASASSQCKHHVWLSALLLSMWCFAPTCAADFVPVLVLPSISSLLGSYFE